jgi:hypothetical protein
VGFDLAKVRNELGAAALASPILLDVAIAVVNDCFRMAEIGPVPDEVWESWRKQARPLWAEQMGMLAFVLSSTSLRAQTVDALRAGTVRPAGALASFFASVEPLTAEMIRANAFRQEEFLRKWVASWQGSIAGESEAESSSRLEQLDYRKALEEYARAEDARKLEAARREKMLQDARDREAAARGWRE